MDKRGLKIVSDEGELTAIVDEVIAANPDVVEKIRGGKVAAAVAHVFSPFQYNGTKAALDQLQSGIQAGRASPRNNYRLPPPYQFQLRAE